MKIPNFFQVGQPKSGTSALHSFLGQHPMIFMSRRKEPLYFCLDFRAEAEAVSKAHRWKLNIRDEDAYLDLFSKVQSELVAGESSTHYLYSKVAAEEIHRFNPEAKILMLLRNPVDFLASYHGQCLVQSLESEGGLERAIALEEARRSGEHIPAATYCPSFLLYSERVKYAEQVQRYLDVFDRERIKVIVFEDFLEDNLKVYREILDFVEVDTSFVPDFATVNPNEVPRSRFLNALAFHPKLRRGIQAVLPEVLTESRTFKAVAKRLLWAEQPRAPLEPDVRGRLKRMCYEEVEKISDLLGIDFAERWDYTSI